VHLPRSTRLATASTPTSRARSPDGHRFSLDRIEEAYELFGNQRDGVVKVALTP
jgi:threonine dehydrogenase-like Zn-dependent dehydrogenase